MLIKIFIPNAPELHFQQGLLHFDFKGLDYDLSDFHTPYTNIEEDMEFTKVLIVKQKTGGKVWELNCIVLFRPLK
jgi:hypothetical protein